jgi:hypothetical protein
MAELIAERKSKLRAQQNPAGVLEEMLVDEIARTGVQVERAQELMLNDLARVLRNNELSWDGDRRQQSRNTAARLARDPVRVSHQLEQTKQGAELSLDWWRGLGESVAAHGRLTEEQRQLAFDLLGTPPQLRDTTARVPAGDDTPGLLALVTRQVKRLEDQLAHTLTSRDTLAREAGRQGLPVMLDKVTRQLRSDEARAVKRMQWAVNTLRQLRLGVSPETLIDYETGQPVSAMAGAKARAKANANANANGQRAAGAASPGPSSPPPGAESGSGSEARRDDPPAPADDGPLPPPPPELSAEDREMLLIFGEHFRQMFRGGAPAPEPATAASG